MPHQRSPGSLGQITSGGLLRSEAFGSQPSSASLTHESVSWLRGNTVQCPEQTCFCLRRFKASLPCWDVPGLQKHRCDFGLQQRGTRSPLYFPSGNQKPFKWNLLVFPSADEMKGNGSRRAVYWEERMTQAVRSGEERPRQRAQGFGHSGTSRSHTRREDKRQNAVGETRSEPHSPLLLRSADGAFIPRGNGPRPSRGCATGQSPGWGRAFQCSQLLTPEPSITR